MSSAASALTCWAGGPSCTAVACSPTPWGVPYGCRGIFPPYAYNGALHVDGGVLDNVPVSALAGAEGPLIAVNISSGGDGRPASAIKHAPSPRVPNIGDTLMRTMMMGSGMAAASTLALADVVIRPNPSGVGLLEFHQIDPAREAGRVAAREALPRIMQLVRR